MVDILHNPRCNRIVICIGHKYGKLIPMEPGRQIDCPDPPDYHLGRQFNHLITGQMPVIIINRFKMVAVQHDEDPALTCFHGFNAF